MLMFPKSYSGPTALGYIPWLGAAEADLIASMRCKNNGDVTSIIVDLGRKLYIAICKRI
jgi:hypothetical protein